MDQLTSQQIEIINYGVNILKPKPVLSGSQWADEYYYLPAEAASIPGKWKTRPWQKDILDSMTCYKVNVCFTEAEYLDTFEDISELEMIEVIASTVVIKKPTRVGYTKMIGAASGYFIHQRPSVQLHYQPNADEAKGFAEDEFEPMVRENNTIAKLIETPNIRGRNKREKTIKKIYPGGYAEFLGAESDRNFNRRTARVVSGDELDTWKKEAGKAGDTVTTMMRRTSDFWDRKNILGGKPIGAAYDPEEESDITDGVSVVDYWFKKGTQCYRYFPCPHCGTYQRLEFESLEWDKEKDAKGNTIKHYPETAHFKCVSCSERIEDKHKRNMDKKGVWVGANKDGIENNIVSYHPWAVLSYSPNVTWKHIVMEFLESKDNKLKFKTFMNEVLARTWEEDYTKVEIEDSESKKEPYPTEVPEGVYVLTFGADTQDDRIECEVIGWGEAEESWSIEYKIFYGDTTKPEVWQRFDEFLLKTYTHENGGKMRVYCGGVDTQGHSAKQAYAFCKARFSRRIFAFKGSNTIDAPIAPRSASYTNKAKVPLFLIGVNQAKDVIYSHISTESPGPGYMHFPADDNYSAEYFKQLTAEKRDKSGRWKKTRARNEAFDVRVYGYSSLFIANIDLEVLVHRGKPIMQMEQSAKPKPKPKKKPRDYTEEY